jgi:diadenosine tetraphosphatase ApaH/serine/threonine PP2A family protein phosphatase
LPFGAAPLTVKIMGEISPRHAFVGDVHGCLSELDALLKKLKLGSADRLIFVGDLCAKGPDSQGVVQRVRELGAACVRDNDEAVLRIRRSRLQGYEPPRPPKKAHLKVAEALEPADWEWLESLPLYLEMPEIGVNVVHAGVVPGKPISKQHPDDLMTMRTIRPEGTASPRLEDGALWAPKYVGPPHVIFGHDAISGLQRERFATGIDTGCVYGRELTALVLPGHELVQVHAKRTYKELER